MVEQVYVLTYPWDINGYCPRTEFHLNVDSNGFIIRAIVTEHNPRREETQNQGQICQDSCVEWFVNFLPDKCDRYFNFEVNPNGAVYASFRKDRFDYSFLSESDIQSLDISTTVCRDVWEVQYKVPFSLIRKYIPNYHFVEGMRIKANFYKCGDLMPFPHYGVWNAFSIDEPDFHRPEFFGDIVLV